MHTSTHSHTPTIRPHMHLHTYGPQVRSLVCVCLTRFYTHGDMLSIYARVSSMQFTLSGKDPGQSIKPISDVGIL